MNETAIITSQLRDTCQLANACWAIWIEHADRKWSPRCSNGLNKPRLQVLQDFINNAKVSAHIAGGLTTGRVRSSKTGGLADQLGCQNLYFFPHGASQSALVVGADDLDRTSRGFFRVLAHAGIPQSSIDAPVEQILAEVAVDLETRTSYDLHSALERILRMLNRYVTCDSTCIGLRYGDSLRLEAVWPRDDEDLGRQVSIKRDILKNIILDQSTVVVEHLRDDKACPLRPDFKFERGQGTWIGVPLRVGKRVIGVVFFFASQINRFDRQYIQRVELIANHIAPAIETYVALAEASLHLEKLALLNEVASAASVGVDADEAAKRIVRRLKRIFNTELVSILWLSPDRKTLHEFGESEPGQLPLSFSVEDSLCGHVVETGLPVRVGDINLAPRYLSLTAGVRSELAVPLKYRGNIIGVLDLESKEPDAFSLRDEQLLVVMASQLAGLIENVRLNDEMRQRARNLGLIHQVVQEVVGLTDITQIAQAAAELMAERFTFELALVNLVDEDGEHLVVEGVGGNVSPEITRGLKKPITDGIAGQVCRDGISRLVNDISLEPDYASLPGWQGGSEMCVPLQDAEFIFGVVAVEKSRPDAFTENDLLALEALAGVLSSVMINARSYQQLQMNLRHLQAVRETALDISADLDLDTLLERVTIRARELVGARGAELGLVNEEQQTVEIKVSENPWEEYSKGLVIPFSQGIAGHMAVNGETLAIDDYNTWSGRVRLGNPAPFTAAAGVPLKYKGKVIGTLTISHDQPGVGFRADDLRLLELLAPQVAVSVRNARLYQELQTIMEAERLANERLIRSARLAAVGELAAGVAHELNNPLTTVAGFVELALDDLPPDSLQRPDLELVLKEARRAREVVRRLLDFSRPGEGFRVRSDVNDLVNEVVALVHHLAHTSGVKLELTLHADLPLIQIDRDQIKQVLLNLVHNAIQAMPRGGKLLIKTAPQERENEPGLIMLVKDTGQGISPENLGRLFEPFFTTRSPGKGTGLGLSVSYGIVTDHGGIIDVESQLGTGSVFTVWLPLQSNKVLL